MWKVSREKIYLSVKEFSIQNMFCTCTVSVLITEKCSNPDNFAEYAVQRSDRQQNEEYDKRD